MYYQTTVPPSPALLGQFERVLRGLQRDQIELAVEILIDRLDAQDGDPDLEEAGDLEPDADAQGDLAWAEFDGAAMPHDPWESFSRLTEDDEDDDAAARLPYRARAASRRREVGGKRLRIARPQLATVQA